MRGATYFYVIHDILTSYFNPRTHEGCDKKVFFAMIGFDILIHASARDVTTHGLIICLLLSYFNPRIRKGCDNFVVRKVICHMILIHASARDVTAKSHKIGSDFSILFRKFMQKLGIAIFIISIF